jgi:hypothetical protein
MTSISPQKRQPQQQNDSTEIKSTWLKPDTIPAELTGACWALFEHVVAGISAWNLLDKKTGKSLCFGFCLFAKQDAVPAREKLKPAQQRAEQPRMKAFAKLKFNQRSAQWRLDGEVAGGDDFEEFLAIFMATVNANDLTPLGPMC